MNNRGMFWGVFLVLLGIVYLLRQFGLIYFHITWLFAWSLWPVILIIAGLRLILPRSSNVAGSLILVVMVFLFAYVVYEGYQMKKNGKYDKAPIWIHPPFYNDDDSNQHENNDSDAPESKDKPGSQESPDSKDKPGSQESPDSDDRSNSDRKPNTNGVYYKSSKDNILLIQC